MVFCYHNCSDMLWEQIVLLNSRPRICKVFQIIITIHSNSVRGQNNFWLQNAFLTCSWRFLISDKLEQLEFKLEKGIGI